VSLKNKGKQLEIKKDEVKIMINGVIAPEIINQKYVDLHKNETVKTKYRVPFWGYSPGGYTLEEKDEQYDQRVAVFVTLRHKKTKQDFVVISTHLMQTQGKEFNENIRKVEIQQLNTALEKYLALFELKKENVSIILAGDLNETRISQKSEKETPMITEIKTTKAFTWVDLFEDQSDVYTSLTLERNNHIDYILMAGSEKVKGKGTKIQRAELLDIKYQPVGPDGKTGVYGLPTCFNEGTLIQPSDHVPLIAEITIQQEKKEL
jgi:hypothetical protein